MGFIFKSMYFHLRTRIYNIIVLILPMIVLFGGTANDFILITFLNVAGSLYYTLVLGSFWIRSSFLNQELDIFLVIRLYSSSFFIFLPLIGMKIFISKSGLFTLTLNEQFYILLSEIALSSFSMVIALFYSKKKKSESERVYQLSHVGTLIPLILILPFSSNFPELYTNHYLLCNCLLSAILSSL